VSRNGTSLSKVITDASVPIEHSEKSALYYSYIPVVPDRSHYRKFDTVALKDIRRRLDGGYCAPEEVDQVAQDLMEDCVVVSCC
jgi:protein JSN1